MSKNKFFKPWFRYLLLALVVAFLSAGLFVGITSINPKANEPKKVLYSYNVNSSVNYNVELFDNNFIDNESLKMDEAYLSNLVKNIHVSFSNNVSGTKVIPMDISYSANAFIVGNYKLTDDNSESKVWKQEYELIKKTNLEHEDGSSYSVNNELDINYSYYDDQATQFKNDNKINIDPHLEIHYHVYLTGYVDGKRVEKDLETILNMPLNEKAFKITKTVPGKINEDINESDEKIDLINKNQAFIGAGLITVGILIFIFAFDAIFKIPKKNTYMILLKKYMKEYDDIIIEIVTPVNEEDMNIVYVKSFDEMLGLEDELRVPVMFYEVIPHKEGIFYLVHENILYEYIFDNDILEGKTLINNK